MKKLTDEELEMWKQDALNTVGVSHDDTVVAQRILLLIDENRRVSAESPIVVIGRYPDDRLSVVVNGAVEVLEYDFGGSFDITSLSALYDKEDVEELLARLRADYDRLPKGKARDAVKNHLDTLEEEWEEATRD